LNAQNDYISEGIYSQQRLHIFYTSVSQIDDPDIPPITVGISRSSVAENFEKVIVVRADKALYAAKELGRNPVETF